MAASDGDLALGLLDMMRGDDGPDAEAAALVLAETVRWWRAILRSRVRVTSTSAASHEDASRAAYERRMAGRV